MKAIEAKRILIDFHLKSILIKIKSCVERGEGQMNFFKLTEMQVYLLKDLGYKVNEFDRNFDELHRPLMSCTVDWTVIKNEEEKK